jgi:hypothetical protein
MPLSLICPECGGKLNIADNLAGKKIKCPKCSAVFPVPTEAEAAITAQTPPAQPEGVTPTVAPEPEIVDERRLRPRLRQRDIHQDPTTEAVSTLIPYKNARALIAYYCGVFSLIPCAGLALGPAAFILGILGLRYVRAHPTAHGTGHAIVGIVLGGLTSLANWGVLIAMIVWGGLAAFKAQSTPTMGGPPVVTVNPGNPAPPQEVNLGQPLFAADRDLVDPNGKLNIPAEPGRVAVLRMGSAIHAIAFAPDGKTLAIANQVDVKLWDLASGSRGPSRYSPEVWPFPPTANSWRWGTMRTRSNARPSSNFTTRKPPTRRGNCSIGRWETRRRGWRSRRTANCSPRHPVPPSRSGIRRPGSRASIISRSPDSSSGR